MQRLSTLTLSICEARHRDCTTARRPHLGRAKDSFSHGSPPILNLPIPTPPPKRLNHVRRFGQGCSSEARASRYVLISVDEQVLTLLLAYLSLVLHLGFARYLSLCSLSNSFHVYAFSSAIGIISNNLAIYTHYRRSCCRKVFSCPSVRSERLQ